MLTNNLEKKFLSLALPNTNDWRNSLSDELKKLTPGLVEIDCHDWQFGCKELKQLLLIVEKADLKISELYSNIPQTIVSANYLGVKGNLNPLSNELNHKDVSDTTFKDKPDELLFHHGTLRSGEHLDSEGDVLLLGDVNPGARISAEGDVMVWGRIRGVAHAGKGGNKKAKIIALELRPLQLRIADKIARGPEGKPEPGLAEEARIQNETILILPAQIKSFNP